MNINILDDYEGAPQQDRDVAQRWREHLDVLLNRQQPRIEGNVTNFNVNLMSKAQIEEAVMLLEERRKQVRENPEADAFSNAIEGFDDSDVLIVDFDLLYLDGVKSGEEVAYLARCFSKCGIVVGIQQKGLQGDFDLRYQFPLSPFADISIKGDHLLNLGLWFPDPAQWHGFRPWYWPALYTEVDRFRQRTSFVKEHLDQPILSSLGFPDTTIESLSRSTAGFLEPGEKQYRETTFRQIALESEVALEPKDSVLLDTEFIARVAASRVTAWLERQIIPGQHILSDAPHLALKFPSIAGSDDVEQWNALAHMTAPQSPVHDKISSFVFEERFPLSRPVWWRAKVLEEADLPERNDAWTFDNPGVQFCEDVSKFVNKSDCRRFSIETDSPSVYRYVVRKGSPSWDSFNLGNLIYAPAVRFAM